AVASDTCKVNAPNAKPSLSQLGIEVVHWTSLRLPFQDVVFDVVIDRHEELNTDEVQRVLEPGGLVLTQQVGRNEWTELRPFFPRMQDFGPLLDQYTRGFRHAGMIIGQAETHDVRVAYRGLGEL